ncbi:MAG: hypothetical protein NZ578_08500 [Candidatus Binatia bacterium]|nr:hypothetical protein [Candidatus Binatia bacterium]
MSLLLRILHSLFPHLKTQRTEFGAGLDVKHTIICFSRVHDDGTVCRTHDCPRLRHELVERWTMTYHNLVVTEGRNTLLNRCFDAVPANVDWYVGLIRNNDGTVSITSGQNSVTGSGTAFASADVGSDIIIVGAGGPGSDLISTVATVTSGTALTTANNAGQSVSGAQYAIEPRPADTMASKSFNENTDYTGTTRPQWVKNGAASGGQMSNSNNRAQFNINATTRIFGAFLSSNNSKGGTSGLLFGGGLNTTQGSRQAFNGETVHVQIDLSVTAT